MKEKGGNLSEVILRYFNTFKRYLMLVYLTFKGI